MHNLITVSIDVRHSRVMAGDRDDPAILDISVS